MPDQHEPLLNPTWDEMVAGDPLISFSWYLSGRVRCITDLGSEVLANLDSAFAKEGVDVGKYERAEMLMWFWVLGAYEVVRTMSQARRCFAESLNERLDSLKKELARVRMPAAKMEPYCKKAPVPSGRSPSGWDLDRRDLLIGEPNALVSGRQLVGSFERLMSAIEPEDILHTHEESYEG